MYVNSMVIIQDLKETMMQRSCYFSEIQYLMSNCTRIIPNNANTESQNSCTLYIKEMEVLVKQRSLLIS